MLHITSLDDGLDIFKALGSDVRIEIIKLLIENKEMNMNELAAKLNITNGALTGHIKKLEACGIVNTSNDSSGHGNQKICTLHLDKILIDLDAPEEAQNVYNAELQVGHYCNYEVYPTCGLATASHLIGEVDDTRYFAHPDRYNADILWFSKGFVEYEIPNFIPGSQKITQILISAELSSEAPGINNVWPSDISFYLNDVCIGTWTSPGDFGDVRGIFTPDWWFPNWNQYGLLKMLVINKKGTFIDGLQISDVTIRVFLGVNLLPSKTSDGQLEINFKDAVAKTNPEMQKALEQDAKVPQTQEMPKPEECVTDEQKVAAMCTIMNMRHKQKSGGIGKNVANMIEFAREAYKLDKDAEPAQVLATVLLKMKEAGRNATLLEGCANAIWGNLTGNLSVLASHAWLKNQLTTYNDAQVANVVKVFLAKKIADETAKNNNYEEEAKRYSQLISGTNDDLINRIITSANNEGKDEDKLVYPEIKGLNLKGKHISAIKTVNNMRIAYGAEMNDKMLKQVMQKVSGLYTSTSLNPLTFYVEKSAYATKK